MTPLDAADWIVKPWGRTLPLVTLPHYHLWFAEIEAGGFCSSHRHDGKVNRFYVRCGVLTIHHAERFIRLAEGQWYDVPAGDWHQFVAHDGPVSCWEIYTPAAVGATVDTDDIIRQSPGGVLLTVGAGG